MKQKSDHPEYRIKATDRGDMIFDCLRQKYVPLTPEEGVRQMFVHYLLEEKGYPAGLMNNEVAITQNGIRRRCDTVVFRRDGQPSMIVEYKASTVAITQAVFDQIYRYNTVLKVDYLVVFNGKAMYCCRMDYDSNTYSFLPEIPAYDSL